MVLLMESIHNELINQYKTLLNYYTVKIFKCFLRKTFSLSINKFDGHFTEWTNLVGSFNCCLSAISTHLMWFIFRQTGIYNTHFKVEVKSRVLLVRINSFGSGSSETKSLINQIKTSSFLLGSYTTDKRPRLRVVKVKVNIFKEHCTCPTVH